MTSSSPKPCANQRFHWPFANHEILTDGRTYGRRTDRPRQPPAHAGKISAREGAPPPHSNIHLNPETRKLADHIHTSSRPRPPPHQLTPRKSDLPFSVYSDLCYGCLGEDEGLGEVGRGGGPPDFGICYIHTSSRPRPPPPHTSYRPRSYARLCQG